MATNDVQAQSKLMVEAAFTFAGLTAVVGGWLFMCDAMSEVGRPRLSFAIWPWLLAIVCGVTAIVLFFCIEWWLGLVAIPGLIVLVNSFAGGWHFIYRTFRL
jgi:hypothetical protein